MSEITIDAAKKLNMTELKSELSKRGLSVNGKKGRAIEKINRSNLKNTF